MKTDPKIVSNETSERPLVVKHPLKTGARPMKSMVAVKSLRPKGLTTVAVRKQGELRH